MAFLSNADPTDRVRLELLGTARLAVVSNGRRRLPAPIRPADLAGQRILISPPPAAIHQIVVRWFRDSDTPVPVFSTCNSLPVTIGLVAAGGGVGVVPHSVPAEIVGFLLSSAQRALRSQELTG